MMRRARRAQARASAKARARTSIMARAAMVKRRARAKEAMGDKNSGGHFALGNGKGKGKEGKGNNKNTKNTTSLKTPLQEANNLKQRCNKLTCQGRPILEQCKNADDNNLWKKLDKSDLERALNKVQNMKLSENSREMMMFDTQAFAKKSGTRRSSSSTLTSSSPSWATP